MVYIEGYEGIYSVTKDGKVFSHKRNIFLAGSDVSGYHKVILFKNNKQETKKVHRLVAKAYLDNPLNLPFVNHKNGIRRDNTVDNLEWCTASYNSRHAVLRQKSKICLIMILFKYNLLK